MFLTSVGWFRFQNTSGYSSLASMVLMTSLKALFWISFHNLPLSIYTTLANRVLKKDGYLNVYFHPWEFMDIGPKKKYNFPFYVTKNTDRKMVERFDKLISWGKSKGYEFVRTYDFIKTIK